MGKVGLAELSRGKVEVLRDIVLHVVKELALEQKFLVAFIGALYSLS